MNLSKNEPKQNPYHKNEPKKKSLATTQKKDKSRLIFIYTYSMNKIIICKHRNMNHGVLRINPEKIQYIVQCTNVKTNKIVYMTKIICQSATLILYFKDKNEQEDFWSIVQDAMEWWLYDNPIVEIESSSDFSFKHTEETTRQNMSKKEAMDLITK